jgi:hypothetical protein
MVWRFLLAAAMATSAQADSGARIFGGWIAGCDNEHVCTAIRTVDAVDVEPSDGGIPFLHMQHHPFRDATPEFRLFDPANPAPDAVLRPPIAKLTIRYGNIRETTAIQVYYAYPDFDSGTRFNQKGGYRFKDEDARSILYGLRTGISVEMAIGPKRIPLGNADLDHALAHFDREQELDDTPGALVLRPGNIMYDYAHPMPPKADTVMLSAFTQAQFDKWLRSYVTANPGPKVKHSNDPARGLVTTIRFASFNFDCGTYERWGHVGDRDEFVLVERREMPVCNGVPETHWIRTYRADTISPEGS